MASQWDKTFFTLLDQKTVLQAENSLLKQSLEEAEKRINWFMEQIKLGKRREYGRQSEARKYLQLEMVFDENATGEIIRANETITYTRKKKTVGRRIDTSKLQRKIIVHDLTDAGKICKCGALLEKFGEDRSEQLDYVPEQIKVIEHVCSKYVCCCCDTVKSASKPEMPIAKSIASPSLIAEVIIKKHEHHLPWHRQSKIFDLHTEWG